MYLKRPCAIAIKSNVANPRRLRGAATEFRGFECHPVLVGVASLTVVAAKCSVREVDHIRP